MEKSSSRVAPARRRSAALPWLALLGALPALADDALDAGLASQVRSLAAQAAGSPARGTTRVEVEVGALDPRLKLAPCARIEPYLPAGARAWGRTRVGLRCTQGPTAWNVTLPVTVKVFGAGLVGTTSLPAGTPLRAEHLRVAEVDWAAQPSAALTDADAAVGRTLARPLAAGSALVQADLKPRQWFVAGDTVQIVAVGAGFSIGGTGQALSPGVEGQPVRVRTESGKVLSGRPAGVRRVELTW